MGITVEGSVTDMGTVVNGYGWVGETWVGEMLRGGRFSVGGVFSAEGGGEGDGMGETVGADGFEGRGVSVGGMVSDVVGGELFDGLTREGGVGSEDGKEFGDGG